VSFFITGEKIDILFDPKSNFCEIKPHAKFQNPTITPAGRKVTRAEEREREEEKNACK
jgi:hypothetical protein